MKIQRLEIFGFGRLHQVTIDLAPGLNIFVGHNEAGKSTLQQAMIALLYGFKQGRRPTAAERDWIERYRPWHSANYGGALVYGLDNGSTYRVTRLAENQNFTTTVVETDSGADVSNSFMRDHVGNVDMAQQHFGVPRDVYLNTFVVRHSDLGPLADAAYDIADLISSGNGKERRSRVISQAQEALRKAMREHIGSERTPASPLAEADERLQELVIEKKMIEMDYRKRTQDLAKQGRLKLNIEAWTRERDEVRYFSYVQRMNTLNFRVFELEKLAENEAHLRSEMAESQPAAGFPIAARDVVQQLSQKMKTHTERLARAEGAAAPSRAQVEEMQAEAARLRESIRKLDPARYAPLEHETAARELERTLPEAIRAHQKSDAELAIVRQALAVLAQSRNAAPRRHVMAQITPERLRDARAKWEHLQQKTADTAVAAQSADAAWQAAGVSDADYAALALKTANVTPDTVSQLKESEAKPARAERALPVFMFRGLRIFGLVFMLLALVSGVVLTTLGAMGGNQLIPGVMLLSAALVFVAGFALMSRHLKSNKDEADQERGALQKTLAQIGFASIADLEAALARRAELAPLAKARQAAVAQAESARDEMTRLRAELHTLYNLPPDTELTADHFAYLESEAQESTKDLNEQAQLERRRQDLEAEVAARRDAMNKAMDAARVILKAAGSLELNLLVELRSLLVQYDQRRELDKLESQLQTLEETLNTRVNATLAIEAEARTERTTVMGLEEELRLVLEKAGISTPDIADGIQQFNDRYRQAERHTRSQSFLQSLDRERSALLRSDTVESLTAEQKRLGGQIQKLLDAYPHLANMRNDKSVETLENEINELTQRIGQARQMSMEIEARLNGSGEQRPLAEIVEEIERAEARMKKLTFENRALQTGLDYMDSAADDYFRNFVPRLNKSVARRLETVTGGHYRAVEVDRGDLGIRIEAPELQRFIRPDNFSQGVQDQTYLLLRLGLAEMISDGRESMPLMLDDPFVNYDSNRLTSALNMLARLSEETQFMLFTKDEQIAAWAGSNGLDGERHRVHLLGQAAPA